MTRAGEGQEFTFWRELGRKSIHLAGGSLAVFYVIAGPRIAIPSLLAFAALVVAGDAARIRIGWLRRIYDPVFGFATRPDEDRRLTGASWYVIGQAATAAVCPPEVVPTAMTFLVLGDTAAAIIGRRWGRREWFPGKSVLGSIAFVVFAFAGGYAWLRLPWYVVLAGALTAMLAEALIRRIDDNVTIPLSGGLAMWGLLALI